LYVLYLSDLKVVKTLEIKMIIIETTEVIYSGFVRIVDMSCTKDG